MIRRRKPITRTSRPRRKRKGKRASLARQCDLLWGQIVRARGACEMCSNPKRLPLQAAHGISRRYRGTRWLPINGFCLCSGCHMSMTHNPLAWDDFLRVEWGDITYDILRRRAQATAKPDHAAILASLKKELGQ